MGLGVSAVTMAGRSHRVPQSVATSCEPSPPQWRGCPMRDGPLRILPTASASAAHVCAGWVARGPPPGSGQCPGRELPASGGERPRALRSGSDFPFLEEHLPRWLCLGFSSTLLRFLRLYNYYLIRGSGLNWLSRRIIVMQFPANRNFLCLALGGCLPLHWTEAESRSCCSGLESHGLGDALLHQHRVKGGGYRALTLMACPTLFKKLTILIN